MSDKGLDIRFRNTPDLALPEIGNQMVFRDQDEVCMGRCRDHRLLRFQPVIHERFVLSIISHKDHLQHNDMMKVVFTVETIEKNLKYT